MKQHEREYFAYRVRSGLYTFRLNDQLIVIKPLTIEEKFLVEEGAYSYYAEAENDGFLWWDDFSKQLKERGLWSEEKEEKIKGLEKDIERLKVELFQNKNKENLVSQIRKYLKAGKKQLTDINNEKYEFYDHSIEGVVVQKKFVDFIKKSVFVRENGEDKPFETDAVGEENLVKLYSAQCLSEASIRELARTEPWRSIWVLRDTETYDLLFNGKKYELTPDQKNLLMWSRMYDNVYESMECPSDDVIEDDDMLDGWFIIQRKDQEKRRQKSEIDQMTSNSKIGNSDEIFVFADNQKSADKINQSNSFHSQRVKAQRNNVIKQQGQAVDMDFQDQQLKMANQQNEAFKSKFRR